MTPQTLSDRKAELLLEGAMYRIGIVRAKATAEQAFCAKTVLFHAIEQMIGLGSSERSASLLPAISQLQTLTPLVLATGSFLSRKRLLKPVIGIGLLIAVTVALSEWRRRSYIDR